MTNLRSCLDVAPLSQGERTLAINPVATDNPMSDWPFWTDLLLAIFP